MKNMCLMARNNIECDEGVGHQVRKIKVKMLSQTISTWKKMSHQEETSFNR